MSFFLRRFEFSSARRNSITGEKENNLLTRAFQGTIVVKQPYCVACSYSIQIAQTQVSPKKYNQ